MKTIGASTRSALERKVVAQTNTRELPGWFPFALLASGLVVIGAGLRSNWGRTAAVASGPPGSPAVKQGGVLQDWGLG